MYSYLFCLCMFRLTLQCLNSYIFLYSCTTCSPIDFNVLWIETGLLIDYINKYIIYLLIHEFKGTDQAGTFMSLKCVVYYANYRSWHQSSKIQVVS